LSIVDPPKASPNRLKTLINYGFRLDDVPMEVEKLLLQKKPPILKRWLQLIMESYPADARRFLKKQKDQFANPVGHTLSKEIGGLYDELLQGIDRERSSLILDRIIRIRAIQDFSPSQALSFIFLLKRVIREEIETEIQEERLSDELWRFESGIDELALMAFDIYMKCREKIYELRANEAKNQVSRLLIRKGLISEVPEWETNTREGNRT